MPSPYRVIRSGWALHLKGLSMSTFFVFVYLVMPVLLAAIAFYLFGSGSRHVSLFAGALGTGMMGLWSTTLFGAGEALTRARREGTLELMVLAPVPLFYPVLAITLASATLGLYSIAATVILGSLLFGMPVSIAEPGWFAAGLLVSVACLGLLGVLLASFFFLYRYANALTNLLETPVWLLCGLLIPVAFLPGWARPISWLLAPTWGIDALRAAAGGSDALRPLLAEAAVGVLYLLLGIRVLGWVERLACVRASLPLA
jgi:ABC-2 type transport system permease protein